MKKLILLFCFGCAREYSCEDCREFNELITSYEIQITPTSVAKFIYPACKTKINPGHYSIFDSVKVTTLDTVYKGSYDLKKYFPMDRFSKGDTFFVFYEIRGRNAFTEQVQHDTLIY